ncbi:MAG: Zn-dependent exopeptidase M28 [archaeon]|nr:Zn-dependent exopeptidase M28 [archaeon]
MKVDDSLTDYAFNFIKQICEKYGPRYSSSKAEKDANLWIKDEFDNYCDETYIDEFETNPNLYTQGFIKMAFILVTISIFFIPLIYPLPIIAALLVIYALFVIYTELFLVKRWIKIFFKKGVSTNTWGKIKPTGETKFRIIFEGHTDSAKMMRLANFDRNPPIPVLITGLLFIVFTLIMGIVKFVALSVMGDAIDSTVLLSGLIQWTIIDWIYFIPSIILFPGFIYLIYGLTGNVVVDGANDNLSGSAVSAAVGKYFSLSENRPKNVEIIIASMGSEEIGDQGANAWVAKHGDLLENAYAFVIDSAGAGSELFIVEKDGMHKVTHSPEVVERMKKAYNHHNKEYPDAISLGSGNLSLGSSDACMYIRAGYKSAFMIVNSGGGLNKPANWHSVTDTWDNIEKKALRDIIGIALNFVEIVDKEYE